jgi:ribosomal protein S18 acetylase RimI-like enzyme
MESSILFDKYDIQALRALRAHLESKSTIVDFDEQILLASIQATTRIWSQDSNVIGFAFVDEYNNLWFETETKFGPLSQLETEIVEWGVTCLKSRNAERGTENTLDCTCDTTDSHRVRLLTKHGFTPAQVRSLHYSRPLDQPILEYPVPVGFSIRCVKGTEEAGQLVELHRATFGTQNMTLEYRLAMMSTMQYIRELDFVAVAPNDDLAAFCVCGFDDPDRKVGYTDPIGTHPSYRGIGLGKALISAGLIALKNARAQTVRLGTSSDNIAMQKLAGESGFRCISEKRWFSKSIP